ncbi:TetR/AcrR family transcriptional regulator [Tsukamurella sp. 8F]|uniref:TetR/AcrR family transcriptional regulator n=1 Tax=unclassified Tsukamurella TaxID=2633480 RepID=UPI0023B8FC98|nr:MULTISPECIES: TetR/AcrR family transcriptional regulator [unclassified Tsukamurella]MDF0531816.1 TetR/AcrR family transcriptional regulator [Tsukamurella sp. 8J]MDF0589058.1 TetR/AcrR family transcriptional regulator [Tsukamurella sp. 8F]
MTPKQRRTQLLDVGEELFDGGRFDELSMEEIAGHADVTRALLYHYFPTKAEFFGAVWQRAHESILPVADLRDSSTVRDWLIDALTKYLAFYEQHPNLVLIANRSSIAAAPAVREPVATTFGVIGRAALDAAGCAGTNRRLAEASFRGWIALVRETTGLALIEHDLTPDENLRICIHALDATVGQHAELSARPAAPTDH